MRLQGNKEPTSMRRLTMERSLRKLYSQKFKFPFLAFTTYMQIPAAQHRKLKINKLIARNKK